LSNKLIPLVSIIIPTYNHAEFIGKALKSIISQTYQNWEAIIIDNKSTDQTNEILRKFNDNRINYYATELESAKEQIFQDKSSRDFAVDILGTHIRPRDEIVSASQSYLAYVNQVVNFRKGPGTEFDIIKALQEGTQIFVISTIDKNGYYNVIDLETNTEGYVYKSYVVLDRVIEINEDDLFVESGKSSSSTVSEVEVYNNTDKVLTVFIGGNSYFFSAQEKRKINIKPGEYDYRVTAPGVLPYLGKDKIVSGFNYSWQFYIITK